MAEAEDSATATVSPHDYSSLYATSDRVDDPHMQQVRNGPD